MKGSEDEEDWLDSWEPQVHIRGGLSVENRRESERVIVI